MSDPSEMRDPTGQFTLGPEYAPPNKNRFVVEVPDKFATARWSRDADIVTIARCMLATLKYEPHAADMAVLRRVLEGVIGCDGTWTSFRTQLGAERFIAEYGEGEIKPCEIEPIGFPRSVS